MTEIKDQRIDTSALEAALEERQRLLEDYHTREFEFLEQTNSERAERVSWWEGVVSETRKNAYAQQLGSYKSLAGSMSSLLGASVTNQAKVMIPFEIAEATKEFARFLGTRDPRALASSLKHALAAKQYASAAKSGGASSGSGGGGAPGGMGGAKPAANEEPEAQKARRNARVIINVGRKVGVVDTYEFARTMIDAINENISDDVVLEVAS